MNWPAGRYYKHLGQKAPIGSVFPIGAFFNLTARRNMYGTGMEQPVKIRLIILFCPEQTFLTTGCPRIRTRDRTLGNIDLVVALSTNCNCQTGNIFLQLGVVSLLLSIL